LVRRKQAILGPLHHVFQVKRLELRKRPFLRPSAHDDIGINANLEDTLARLRIVDSDSDVFDLGGEGAGHLGCPRLECAS